MASYQSSEWTLKAPEVPYADRSDPSGEGFGDRGKVKVEAWPAAGGGLMLAASVSILAPTSPSVSKVNPNFFLVCESEQAIKLIVPYVRLAPDAARDISQLLERRMKLRKGGLSIDDIASRAGAREPHASIVGHFAVGGCLDARLKEVSDIFHHLVISAAASVWAVPPEACLAFAGHVVHPASRLRAPFDQFYRLAAYEMDRWRY